MTETKPRPKIRKGIILAGGSGTRLYPITIGVSKQLLPVYVKPMIYCPLSVLMLAGLREIAVITTPEDQAQFQRTLGDGSQWGITLTYIVQPSPDGLAQAFVLAEDFLDGHPSVLVLGDNIFYGADLPKLLANANEKTVGASVFGYRVADPERYGVVDFDADGHVKSIIEKPEMAPSNYVVTSIYFVVETARARQRGHTFGPWRTGDCHPIGKLSGRGPAGRGTDGARLRLARHRNSRIASGCRQFRAHSGKTSRHANGMSVRDCL